VDEIIATNTTHSKDDIAELRNSIISSISAPNGALHLHYVSGDAHLSFCHFFAHSMLTKG
jgi:hypothetical protein